VHSPEGTDRDRPKAPLLRRADGPVRPRSPPVNGAFTYGFSKTSHLLSSTYLTRPVEHSAELALFEELANAYWRLLRLHRVENQYWEHLGGCYNRGDQGIAEALIQSPDKQTRNFFRYYGQVERSYYRTLAAVNQIKRDKGNAKSVKTQTASATNGFVSHHSPKPPVASENHPVPDPDGCCMSEPPPA
jgi:hypothetical protein